MTDRLIAEINPNALEWVRNAIGMPLDVAAKKIGVSVARLEEFEEGANFPTIKQLRVIAKIYKRPTAFFYIQTLPNLPQRIHDFRSLPDEHDPEYPGLLDAVEAAKQRRVAALELSGLLQIEMPDFGVIASMEVPAENLARQIRTRLGVEYAEQITWRDKYAVLRNWISAIEHSGVLVSQFSGVDVAVARGFSLSHRPLPILSINGKDSPRAKVFTIIHELAHIALGEEGICDLHNDEHNFQIEPYCNQVAAEVLVPEEFFLREPLVNQNNVPEWEEWRLSELAATYGVSKEVILRRLLSFNRTTYEYYNAKRDEYAETYRAAQRESKGFLPHYRRVLRDNGVAFTNLVLEAYRSDFVTPTEVSRLLGGVKFKHVQSIQGELSNRAA